MTSESKTASPRSAGITSLKINQIESREWWLWGFAVIVTLSLTAGIVFLTFFDHESGISAQYWTDLKDWVRGLAALVLLFDLYTMYQHMQLQGVRRQLADRDELFQLITENAADMIAVVDSAGNRLYNSPAYSKVLGYSEEELGASSAIDQIHPSDRERVLQAAAKARASGRGQRLEYRMRHKNGDWRILESTASPIQNGNGRLERLVIVNRDITERKRAEEMLEHRALHDVLTELPNRALFVDRLQHSLIRARRHSDYTFVVLFIDIDGFKVLNDSLGHSAGDELLIQVAKRLTACFRETDTVSRSGTVMNPTVSNDSLARLGGDEFTVLLDDVSEPSDAIRVARRILDKIAQPFTLGGQQIVISASVGIAASNNSYGGAEDLLRDAEIAMYRAKQAGKARCEVFDPAMHSSAVRRLKLETDLRRGIEHGELLVYYQPIISLESGRIVGFEALSRWKTVQGMVPPVEFIPVADETGLIIPMNRALYLESCQQLKAWQAKLNCTPPLTMSLNITPRQFAQPDLAKEIGEILAQSGIQPSSVNLEITETIAMGDADHAFSVLSDLKALGVRLSIDDFGTGYSSLSRLPRFPIDALKIDRVFISQMSADHDNHEIVRLIISLAHSLGLKVVAEGTETQDEVNELKHLKCEMVQGFLYSPPVDSVKAFDLLLASHGAVMV
ncbi:MAG TPA: EAL domain-containing protein [Terriglobales bacterium]|jgi:PAS domain S-box-containing protein|nr:EAL domain-containing protein [Terriglobales bacterium]